MWRPLSSFGSWLTKVESWWTLGVMITGTSLFAWLGHQWAALSEHGWAAVSLIAFIGAALVIVALSLAYLAISHFRRDAPKRDKNAVETRRLEIFANNALFPAIEKLNSLIDDTTFLARANNDTVGVLLREFISSPMVWRSRAARHAIESQFDSVQQSICEALEAYLLAGTAASIALGHMTEPPFEIDQAYRRWSTADKDVERSLNELVGALPDRSILRMRLRMARQRFSHLK